jgi:signal transduction histidine kinase
VDIEPAGPAERVLRAALETVLLEEAIHARTVAAARGGWHKVANGVTSTLLYLGIAEAQAEGGVAMESAQLGSLLRPVNDGLARIREIVDEARRQIGSESFVSTVAVDLNPLLDKLISEASNGSTVRWAFEPGPSRVNVPSAILLETAIRHLLRNAVEGTGGRGAASASVSTRADGTLVGLRVVDDGPGFSGGSPKLNEPFHTTKTGHLGLGLFTCARFARAAGGRFEAGTSPSGGAIVELWLPASDHPPTASKS